MKGDLDFVKWIAYFIIFCLKVYKL